VCRTFEVLKNKCCKVLAIRNKTILIGVFSGTIMNKTREIRNLCEAEGHRKVSSRVNGGQLARKIYRFSSHICNNSL
jgi:hypothetical protein